MIHKHVSWTRSKIWVVSFLLFDLEHMKRVTTLLVFPSSREKISQPIVNP